MKDKPKIRTVVDDSGNEILPPQKLTSKQYRFVENWCDPKSDTFGNIYQSAIAAGFSKHYARSMTTTARNLKWIAEAKQRMTTFDPDHIYRAMQDIAKNGKVERDKLKALEMMGKAQGMFIDRVQSQVNVTFINDVPRPEIIDIEPTNEVEQTK